MGERLMSRKLNRVELIVLLGIGFIGAGLFSSWPEENLIQKTTAQGIKKPDSPNGVALKQKEANADAAVKPTEAAAEAAREDSQLTVKSPAAYDPNWDRDYPQDQRRQLMPFPNLRPGDITPVKLYLYGGPGASSFASVDDVADFRQFYERLSEQKPAVMARWKAYLNTRYVLSGKTDPEVTMTRGKHIPVGPVAKLPDGVKSWEELANLTTEELLKRDLFPEGFRPLAHPLQSTGHMLFPERWLNSHPEDTRFDVDFDIPDAYLPEFPAPLFLTTRPDLGDVSRGEEITEANYYRLFNGIITPEQLKGLEKLVIKSNSSWFNQTKHRLTKLPSQGIACFDCHVNGHTNGAIEMDPATRPTLARVRLDTPSLRGNNTSLMYSLRRSIRSVDHFAEVEEYFDGDIGLAQQIGGREFNKGDTNLMGDFNL